MNRKMRPAVTLAGIALLAAGAVWQVRSHRANDPADAVVAEAVERHDIALTIEASGTIEPVDPVEVKSKASGTITIMPVSVGSKVKAGDLMVQIDTRDVRNQYDQALAALNAAEAKVQVSQGQKTRSDELFSRGVITADEHDAAQLDLVNAQAALVTARTNLDLAKQRLDDATVRAPVAGTVLSAPVSAGQVISSATSSVSGGTTLLTMADLDSIRMRALVAETDLGQVRPGQHATVTVDAYPDRTFEGTVEKIEPQAVIQQSVTNFPVLVSLVNENDALLPGMNGEVSLIVDHRNGVPAVPVDAVRSLREALVLAPTLGLNADSVRTRLMRSLPTGAMGDGGGHWRDSTAAGRWRGRDSLLAGGRPAWGDSARARHGHHGFGGGRGNGGAGWRGPESANAAAGMPGGTGGPGGGGWGGGDPGAGGGGMRRPDRAQVVFVKTATGIEPRLVKLGLSDFDWSEVISGVKEGEAVVQLGIAQAQASRTQQQTQIRQRVGTMPGGIGGGGGGGGGGAGGGGGSGRRGGS